LSRIVPKNRLLPKHKQTRGEIQKPTHQTPGDQKKSRFPPQKGNGVFEIASGGGIISLRRHDPDQVQRVIRSSGFSVALATPRCAGRFSKPMIRPSGYFKPVHFLSDANAFGNREIQVFFFMIIRYKLP
jgi:hypothetical protein